MAGEAVSYFYPVLLDKGLFHDGKMAQEMDLLKHNHSFGASEEQEKAPLHRNHEEELAMELLNGGNFALAQVKEPSSGNCAWELEMEPVSHSGEKAPVKVLAKEPGNRALEVVQVKVLVGYITEEVQAMGLVPFHEY